MSSSWNEYFQESLEARARVDCRRYLGTGIRRNRAEVIDFGSNDYLGLAACQQHDSITFADTRSGSASSPVLLGYSSQQDALEAELADLFATDSAVVFSSGYAANAGVIGCMATDSDLLLSDQLNHASLIDGCRLSRATRHVFPHGNVDYVADFLERHRGEYRRALIVTETIFSMDGDLAPLAELASIAEQWDAGLIVDEAHALGIYGAQGAGLSQEVGISDRVLLKLGTLSKSAGCVGGYAAGSSLVVDYLVNYCRSLIFSTAPSPMVMEAAKVALQQMRLMDGERETLRERSCRLRERLVQQGWQVVGMDSDSPIVPVLIGDANKTRQISERLLASGIYVPAIRPPTVPDGTSRLRISLSAGHTEDEISRLLNAMRDSLDG